MGERLARKLLIVGWDAADWKVIDPLLARSELPNLRRLIESGVRANLASLDPKLSPILWTSIATGKTADKHGILNFVEPDASGRALRIISGTSRRVKALWNILSQSGLRTNVVNWYATHPAEPIRGVMISNLFQEGAPQNPGDSWPPAPGAVHPESLAQQIADLRIGRMELGPDDLRFFLPRLDEMSIHDRPVQAIAKAVTQTSSVHNAATSLLERGEWDCATVFYDLLDVLGHHFMQHHPPRMAHVSERDFALYRDVMVNAYRFMDLMLGRLLELAGPDATVILVSDHGFFSDHLRPIVQADLNDDHAVMDATWHRHHGILVMSGPGVIAGGRVYGASLLDITPTALALLGVPVGADMDGRVLVEALDRPIEPERVFSWETLEGDAGTHVSAHDSFESQEAMAQLVDLGYMEALPADGAEQLAIVRRETKFNLGLAYLTTRRAREALPLLQEAHALKPEEGRYTINLARCYYSLGRLSEACAALETFLVGHPESLDARVLLATAMTAQGKSGEAAAALEEIAAQNPQRLDLVCLLGEAYVQLGQYDRAEPLLARVAEADPHSARARHGLALAALNRERYADAVSHALDAVSLVHFYPDAHYTLGAALTWMGDYEHAVKSFQVALSMQPGLIDAHRYLATIYRRQGDTRNAAIHRDTATRLVRERKAGQSSIEDLMREPPMGPQAWAQRMRIEGPD